MAVMRACSQAECASQGRQPTVPGGSAAAGKPARSSETAPSIARESAAYAPAVAASAPRLAVSHAGSVAESAAWLEASSGQ